MSFVAPAHPTIRFIYRIYLPTLIRKFVFAIIGIQAAAETKKKWPWTPVKDNNFGEKSYYLKKDTLRAVILIIIESVLIVALK